MPEAVEVDLISYNTVINACAKAAEWQQALSLFAAISQNDFTPDVISYNATMSAFEKGGQLYQAWSMFHAMAQADVQPNTISHNAFISACEKSSAWQNAMSFWTLWGLQTFSILYCYIITSIQFAGFKYVPPEQLSRISKMASGESSRTLRRYNLRPAAEPQWRKKTRQIGGFTDPVSQFEKSWFTL